MKQFRRILVAIEATETEAPPSSLVRAAELAKDTGAVREFDCILAAIDPQPESAEEETLNKRIIDLRAFTLFVLPHSQGSVEKTRDFFGIGD